MPTPCRRSLIALSTATLLAALAGAFPAVAQDTAGLIVLMRHAKAPGTGDPAGFRLDDCATQRNLSEDGRTQAARIGGRLRQLGIDEARVLSSQWCRCLDTARLLDLGPVKELPVLNSFFGQQDEEKERITQLRQFLADLPRDGKPVVLVTHQVTVTALTGIFPASGEAVLLRANGTPNPKQVDRLTVP
ncbi:histidine phosphatase family protein [Azospirillum melinis]|uniref:Histidine phosphatase family protein n=1 Tax=Azospirillum melinis TaxID=328839 RepID=A0ABX2K3I6_9PROT|nr:histidine phosphatase family protein [Azospirillum melinis]MBP2306498.1 broad specificity phosphatase PhoE [Azospirillum melinis]NUA98144.1 histidine phosphatase family protein [Azospirillum melinis]